MKNNNFFSSNKMSCYTTISDFGSNEQSPMTNPLTYCSVSQLDASFNHPSTGSLNGPDSGQCQFFMASYCANKWDPVCEYVSRDTNSSYPNMVGQCNQPFSNLGQTTGNALTKGEILIANTAAEKYLVAMSDNCIKMYQPFDPTVAASPLIGKWVVSGDGCASGNCNSQGGVCVPIYDVNPSVIDQDPVMNKILAKPEIWVVGLMNIYNNRNQRGSLGQLQNTKLYSLFMSAWFQNLIKAGARNY